MLRGYKERISGYLHPGYPKSLAEFGIPHLLSRSGGWILKRRIPGFPLHDGIGCYPIFVCEDWSQLQSDLQALKDELVSVALVTDPFGQYDKLSLEQCFKDVVIPFKKHYIVDLDQPLRQFVSEHHRRYARKALKNMCVERPERPIDFLDDWVKLYDELIVHHNIEGMLRFSRKAFAEQLAIPGMVMFRAVHEESTVGLYLWYLQGEVAYYHLGASSYLGYQLNASFALVWSALEYFQAGSLRWLNLGSGAGVKNNAEDGLSVFKRGWATGTRTVYFCGHVFDQKKYAEIVKAKGIADADIDYFPAYRQGEFV